MGLCAAMTINYIPMFDFDVNLLRTDARLMAMQLIDGEWVPINVTDEEWAQMKDKPNYKKNPNMDFYRQDSDEEGYDTFKSQVLRAINNPDNFGSAYPLWKKHVINGVPFFMITARSHFPGSIRDGMEALLRNTLTAEELDTMTQNFVEAGQQYGINPAKGWWGEAYRNSDNIIKNYLYGCEFYAVSGPFWSYRHDCNDTALCKAVVVRSLVPYALAFSRHGEDQVSVMSFYDDTKENVVAVKNEMENLVQKYPQICFRVYDTHDTKKYIQFDIGKACDDIEPGFDWQSKDFHSLPFRTERVKLHH